MCKMIVCVEVSEDNIMSSLEMTGVMWTRSAGDGWLGSLPWVNCHHHRLFQSGNSRQAPAACLALGQVPSIQACWMMLKGRQSIPWPWGAALWGWEEKVRMPNSWAHFVAVYVLWRLGEENDCWDLGFLKGNGAWIKTTKELSKLLFGVELCIIEWTLKQPFIG